MNDLVDQLRQDVRSAARQLVRSPVSSLLALFSLAIGITVAVTAFSLLNSVLFKPLPVREPGGIVHVYSSDLARTREIGVRMALGARPRDASFAVIRAGLGYVLIGSAIGLALCVPAAIFAGDNFIGARASDPLPFAAVLLAIVISSAAAAWVPARRAARIQPLEALRQEH